MITSNRACRAARTIKLVSTRRWLSQSALDRLAQPVQSYISTSPDPYLNLSIEHYLLQKSAPDSAILLLYINRPSIIIGRNQNPWLEVNLALLNPGRNGRPETEPPGLGAVDLVRRRSGGGTVFHDEGNVNWTVICPAKDFTRDKHAEMVTRALRNCGADRARVNERHDIVLDQGQRIADVDPNNTHVTPYTRHGQDVELRPLKVSGSAYKLTRQRALHHGTALLSSPNLNIIPDYLHSPAKPYMTARGVESVSSPVGNILLSNTMFIEAVQREFASMYGNKGFEEANKVGKHLLEHELVRKGYDELKSLDWTFLQTPQFTISNSGDTTARTELELTVRNGALASGFVRHRSDAPRRALSNGIPGQKLHEIRSWSDVFSSVGAEWTLGEREQLNGWLRTMLPSHLMVDAA